MASKVFVVVSALVLLSTMGGCDEQFGAEKPSDYPQELFNRYIKENGIFRNNRYEGEAIETYHDNDAYNCHTKVTIIQPWTVLSNMTTKYVVQVENTFQQLVRQTQCYSKLNDGNGCLQGVQRRPTIKTKCVPTDGIIKLHLYNPVLERFEHEAFSFPACCSCHIDSI